VIDKDMQE